MFKKIRGKIKQKWDGYKIRKGWLPRGRMHLKVKRTPGAITANIPVRATLSARVIRKDGTIEDLGVIAQTEGDKNAKS